MGRQMLLLTTILLVVTWCFSLNAQPRVAVVFAKSNKVFQGRSEELTILADNISCLRLKVVAKYGTIESLGGCRYRFTCDSVIIMDPISGKGEPQLIIYRDRVDANNIIEIVNLNPVRVQYPRPYCSIGGRSHDSLSVTTLRSARGIGTHLPGFDFELPFEAMLSFTMSVLRKEGTWTRFTAKGRLFTDEMKTAFTSLKSGDRVLASDVLYQQPDGEIVRLDSVEFYLTE